MIKIYFLLLVTLFSTLIYAEESSVTTKIIPTFSGSPPTGIVCAMAICPNASLLAKRQDIACPSYCENNCRIIDDVCCPGVQKAVCNSAASASSSGDANASISNANSMPTAAPTLKPTQSANTTVPVPTVVVESSASSFIAGLSTCILVSLLTIGVCQMQ
ncbi:hypothetical protein BD770DRAFT_377882 [Pilaira anomala]|nr:hypothetical protein BD770DRAFT_377882 [Pilaira anomala]